MTQWMAWHIYQHDRQDELLVHAVAPLICDLRYRGKISDAFVLRYWEGGPHVRLRLRSVDNDGNSSLEHYVRRRISRWCALHPSLNPMTDAQYQVLQTNIARNFPPVSSTRLVGDGEVIQSQYFPEHTRYGTGNALVSCESHFDESTNLALEVLAENYTVPEREVFFVLILVSMVRKLSHGLSKLWIDGNIQLDRHTTTKTVVNLAKVDRLLNEPPSIVSRFNQSVERLAGRLREFHTEYKPPNTAFGDIALYSTDLRDPAATLDICVHLFGNRIGVIIPQESRLRAAVAQAFRNNEGLTNEGL
jgi:hypothetical protein